VVLFCKGDCDGGYVVDQRSFEEFDSVDGHLVTWDESAVRSKSDRKTTKERSLTCDRIT
jgi:hypothetical protein